MLLLLLLRRLDDSGSRGLRPEAAAAARSVAAASFAPRARSERRRRSRGRSTTATTAAAAAACIGHRARSRRRRHRRARSSRSTTTTTRGRGCRRAPRARTGSIVGGDWKKMHKRSIDDCDGVRRTGQPNSAADSQFQGLFAKDALRRQVIAATADVVEVPVQPRKVLKKGQSGDHGHADRELVGGDDFRHLVLAGLEAAHVSRAK